MVDRNLGEDLAVAGRVARVDQVAGVLDDAGAGRAEVAGDGAAHERALIVVGVFDANAVVGPAGVADGGQRVAGPVVVGGDVERETVVLVSRLEVDLALGRVGEGLPGLAAFADLGELLRAGGVEVRV